MLTINESMDLSDLLEEQKKTNVLLEKLNNNISDLVALVALNGERTTIEKVFSEDKAGIELTESNYGIGSLRDRMIRYYYYDRRRLKVWERQMNKK